MPLSGLDEVGRRRHGSVVGGAGKRVGAGAIGEIVEPTATDIGDVDTEAELMLAVRIRREIGAVEMVLCPSSIPLRTACSEQSRDRDLSVGQGAGNR